MTNAERQRRHRQLMAQREEIDMDETTQLRVPPPLPATRTDLLAGYKLKRRRNINDLVEEIVVKLWDADDQFMKLIEPIYDSQALEGSIDENYSMAALLIRDIAKKDKHIEVANQNLHTIKLALKVVLRRFGISVPERSEQAGLRLPEPSQPAPQATESTGGQIAG